MLQTLRDMLWAPEPVITVQQFFGDSWNWLFQALTLLGASPGIATLLAITFWLKGHRFAWRIAGILLLTVTTNAILWNIVNIPRPDDPRIEQRATVSVSSFPSGHTASATAVWGLLAAFHYIPSMIVVLVVAAVMVSRLYLGVHFPGDLLGGLVVGLVALAIYTRLHAWFVDRTTDLGQAIIRRLGRYTFPITLVLGIGAAAATLAILGLTQKGFEIGGAVLGAGVALPLEARYLAYRPVASSKVQMATKVMIGLAGLGLFGLVKPLIEGPASAIIFALAPLWMILIAPAIFSSLERRWQPSTQ